MPHSWSWRAACQPCRRRAAAPKIAVCPFSGQSSGDGKCPFAAAAAGGSSSSASPAAETLAKPLLEGLQAAAPTPAKAAAYSPAKAAAEKVEAKIAPQTPLERSLQKARLLLKKQDYEKAWEEFERAIGLDNKCEEAYLGKVEALRALKRFPKAYSACRQALDHLPGNEVLTKLGEEVRQEYQAGKQEREQRFKEQLRAEEEQAKAKAPETCPGTAANKDSRTKEEVSRQLADWAGRTPSAMDRMGLRETLINVFKEQYERLGKAKTQSITETANSTYAPDTKNGLQIQGGHRPMPRPKDVALPAEFRRPVGVLSVEELGKYNCENQRLLISVFGDIFDVSDRPDKYGREGPYSFFAGVDITWGLVSGKDTQENANRFYDVWKIAPETVRDGKLQGLCSWRAFYEVEYGPPVGRLDVFEREAELPPPPMDEAEGCAVM